MSAAERSAALMDTLGFATSFRCPCGGGWWYETDGELGAAIHVTDCPLGAVEPPLSCRVAGETDDD